MRAINARLPDDVLVRSIEVVPDAFNPIANCTSKGYSYTVWCSDHRPLRERKTALHLWHRLDVGAMRAAAAEIVGEHDFAGFAAAGHGRVSTVRTVFGCEVVEEESGSDVKEGNEAVGHQGIEAWPMGLTGEADGPVQKLVIRVWGNGFLWNMVRIIAGTLVEAGKGKSGPERVREALRTGNRRMAGSMLPAHGLCLEWIRYGPTGASGVVDEE
jgi:tRNA pseudouridine38-40 synthase